MHKISQFPPLEEVRNKNLVGDPAVVSPILANNIRAPLLNGLHRGQTGRVLIEKGL